MKFYYKGKKIESVGFVGFGISNSSLYLHLKKKYPDLNFSLRIPRGENPGFSGRFFSGEGFLKGVYEDLLFFSPSIKRDGDFNGALLSSDIEYFFSSGKRRVYGISGSDGKSTSATFLSLLIENSALCGNIGVPVSNFLDYSGDVVMELSSFQLNYFSPQLYAATLTNLSENHLDFHGDFESYVRAKENIFKNSKRASISADMPYAELFARRYKPFCIYSYEKDFNSLSKEYKAERYITQSDGWIYENGRSRINAKRLLRLGEYTLKNFITAISLLDSFTGREEAVTREFVPLKHRCTRVLTRDGVDFYDSSIDSSPERCAATLSRFSKNVILILGGRDKNLPLLPLKSAIARCVRLCVLYGECGEKMMAELQDTPEIRDTGTGFCYFKGFFDAVSFAKASAVIGDSVLLSPAATSYDQFSNFEERGDEFTRIIKL